MPTYPLSIDNRPSQEDYYATHWLDPAGESGKHAAYGALHRDRPCSIDPSERPDWALENMRREVRWAKDAGLDGFVLDVLGLPDAQDDRLWSNSLRLLQAAQDVGGFRIILMPDMAALRERKASEVAAALASLSRFSSTYRLDDGALLLMPFAPEVVSVDWWSQLASELDRNHGDRMALAPLFVSTDQAVWRRFAAISRSFAFWGARNPKDNAIDSELPDSVTRLARFSRELGMGWIETVGVQDARPRSGRFEEALNSENLRTQWRAAMELAPEMSVIISWNDYSEGHHILPSQMHGRTFLDLIAYFVRWYKEGRQPTPQTTTVFLTHRRQPFDAKPTYPQQLLMTLRGTTEAANQVEALALSDREGTIWIEVGGVRTSCEMHPGLSVCRAPLRPGLASAWLNDRLGQRIAAVSSPHPVADNLRLQDLQYVGATSGDPSDSLADFRCPR